MDLYKDRLRALRQWMAINDLSGFLIPRVDRYQGEYVAECDERLAWLTGFTGSAGAALILKDKAALFVDGRYGLQARQEIDLQQYDVYLATDLSPQDYIKAHLAETEQLGLDPWLHTVKDHQKWQGVLGEERLILVSENPIDHLWQDRPHRPLGAVQVHPLEFAGLSHIAKIATVQQELVNLKAEAMVLTTPDALCWLLNIRGQDFPHTPLVDAMAIVFANKPVSLYIDREKMTADCRAHFSDDVIIYEPDLFFTHIQTVATTGTVVVDPVATPLAITKLIAKSRQLEKTNLCDLPKALKNPTEQQGAITAHIRDGVALAQFLAWFNGQEDACVTEMGVATKLEEFRQQGQYFQGLSFPTIAGFADNGAIVHYRASSKTSKTLVSPGLFLLDSGAQYLDGTTDVTRTLAWGEPTAEQRQRFTLVLKGHIALATAKFPTGTTGAQLDILARQYLWQQGLDYDHGTGHGVGSFLSVHEGPQRISKYGSSTALQPGMILSNEPGYYKTGEYGIRIENLVMVEALAGEYERPMLAFRTLTMAPIDVRLIDYELLSANEKDWLNDYHLTVRETLLPFLDPETATWLIEVTEPIY